MTNQSTSPKYPGIRSALDGSEAVVMMETLTAIKRAGADMILTYFAIEAAKVLNES